MKSFLGALDRVIWSPSCRTDKKRLTPRFQACCSATRLIQSKAGHSNWVLPPIEQTSQNTIRTFSSPYLTSHRWVPDRLKLVCPTHYLCIHYPTRLQLADVSFSVILSGKVFETTTANQRPSAQNFNLPISTATKLIVSKMFRQLRTKSYGASSTVVESNVRHLKQRARWNLVFCGCYFVYVDRPPALRWQEVGAQIKIRRKSCNLEKYGPCTNSILPGKTLTVAVSGAYSAIFDGRVSPSKIDKKNVPCAESALPNQINERFEMKRCQPQPNDEKRCYSK